MAKQKEEKSKKEVTKKVNKDSKKKDKKQKKVNKKSYIDEIKYELKKVKWPTKKEMTKYSIAVLVFIVVFGLYFYGLDALFAWISSLVKGL